MVSVPPKNKQLDFDFIEWYNALTDEPFLFEEMNQERQKKLAEVYLEEQYLTYIKEKFYASN